MKRLLSLILVMLAITWLTTLLAQSTAGDKDAEAYAVLSENNTVLTFYYDGNKSAFKDAMPLPQIGTYAKWTDYKEYITTVVFDPTFANNVSLTSTSRWFYDCSKLTTIQGIENLKTDHVTNMSEMFCNCSLLTNINVLGFNTANVTDMSSMFAGCSSLTSLDISNFNTSNVLYMGGMFAHCSSLMSLDVSNFDTSNVIYMYSLFSGCSSLTTLNLSNFKTDKVEYMSNMFQDCAHLSNLDLSNFNTSSVTNMSFMFSGCSSLTTLDVSSFNTSNVTNMMFMFDGCSSLTSLDISNFDTQNTTNMSYMFSNCSALTSLDVSKFNTANVTAMTDMFFNCHGLTNLDLSSFNTDNVEDMSAMFYNLSVSELDLSSFNTSNVTSMTGMFESCVNLTSIDLSHFNTEQVYQMNGMFSLCTSLTSLDLSSFNTANLTEMEMMFRDCSALSKIYVGNEWTMEKATSGNEMFIGCTSLVGGAGTTYDANHTDYTYAHIDGGPSNPGYFTDIADTTEVEAVEPPTFRFEYVYDSYLTIETDTPDAEIFYTLNGRLLEGDDTNFGYNSLSRYSNWSVWGDNQEAKIESYRGYNDTYCLKLTSKTDSVFESAQAGYKFKDPLAKDGYYTIRFMARSESGRGQIQFYCQNDTLENTRSAAETFAIGSEYADYEMTVKIDNDKTNQFVLNFGAVADTYYIDNVLFGPVISDTTNLLRTRYEQPIELREAVTVKAVAVKEGMKDSEPAVYDYFYAGWRNMLETYDIGRHICNMAYGDPNVPLPMVAEVEKRLADMFYHYYERRLDERFDDQEIMSAADEMRHYVYMIEMMMRGFTIDGVCYHAIDSTQAEVIAPLSYYDTYKGAITVAGEVNYNDMTFQVTKVADGAFANSRLAAIVWNPTFALADDIVAEINNPNLLVYVNEASLAPGSVKNVIVNGAAKSVVLTDAKEGNNDFSCPQAFTAENITYTRNFQQQTQVGVSRGWESIALPFNVQTITHETQGVIAPFGNAASGKHFWLKQLTESGLQSATKIEANIPYIISMPNDDMNYSAEFNLSGQVTFTAENVIIPVTEPVTLALADSTIMMVPAFQSVSRSSVVWAINVGETRGQYFEGSVFERDYREVRPFEAYTVHTSEGPAPRFVPIKEIGETTGIETIEHSPLTIDQWYDLNGRRLQQKPAKNGVYLYKGRKVVIDR